MNSNPWLEHHNNNNNMSHGQNVAEGAEQGGDVLRNHGLEGSTIPPHCANAFGCGGRRRVFTFWTWEDHVKHPSLGFPILTWRSDAQFMHVFAVMHVSNVLHNLVTLVKKAI